MPRKAIDVLVDRYLIRREWHAGAPWYELTHDRLIKPIKDSNKAWRYKCDEERAKAEEERAKALAETSERIRHKYCKLKIVLPIIATILVSSIFIAYYIGIQHAPISVANGYSFLDQWGSRQDYENKNGGSSYGYENKNGASSYGYENKKFPFIPSLIIR
jgi:hypothetical protein